MMKNRDESGRVIRASELGAYEYCAHAWWLGSVEGLPADDSYRLQEGVAVHERHGRGVVLGIALSGIARWLLILAGLAGLGWLVQLLTG
jgi:hypothetical protein